MIMFRVCNIRKLREEMAKKGLRAYLVVTGDPHSSEEGASFFLAERLFFCPFTGDAGSLLVTENAAYLFTDGRFFIQADKQLKDSGIQLMKMGDKAVPPLEDFIREKGYYPLGVNKYMLSQTDYLNLSVGGGKIVDADFSYLISDRPLFPEGKAFAPSEALFSLDMEDKLEQVALKTEKAGAKANLICSLDDIAWILNLRGSDIPYTPVFYSYLYVSSQIGTHLFIDEKKIEDVRDHLNGITIHPYDEIVSFLQARDDVPTLVNPNKVNARLFNILKKPISGVDPSSLMKSVKGVQEISNTKRIQIIDGVALVKFMKYLEDNLHKGLSEYDYSEKLEGFRRESPDLFDLSFGTIAAFGPNAAMMHYAPTVNDNSKVTSSGIELLVDSGGQYYGGTTDTTRTFLVGKPTAEYIHDYTLTLKSVIALTEAVFLDGTSGIALDVLARQYMWNEGLDYKCGTGHGVGYMLCCHEGPNGFRYRIIPHRDEGAKMIPGMITTIEPGVYKEGKYGIRIENNVLCVPAYETEMGTFYKFETITMVPIETSCLDLGLLTDKEISWLNNYHKKVYENLSPFFKDGMLSFLKEKTAAIKK